MANAELQLEDVKKDAVSVREKLLAKVPQEFLECYVQQRIWIALKSGHCSEDELFFLTITSFNKTYVF